MKTVAASDARQAFARVIDIAAHEPVLIQRRRRDLAVLVSMQEYERLTQVNPAEFQRLCDAVDQRAVAAGMDEQRLDAPLNRDA